MGIIPIFINASIAAAIIYLFMEESRINVETKMAKRKKMQTRIHKML